jgi:hypothetical protein
MPKRLPKKNYLLGLQMLTLALDHNHAVFATLVACLLNSSPNLRDLRIIVSPKQQMFVQSYINVPAAACKMFLLCITRTLVIQEAMCP